MAAQGLTGGSKLSAYLDGIQKRLMPGGVAPSVRVGFLEGQKYQDLLRTPVAQVAFENEFGTQKGRVTVPPRPFFRNMIAAQKSKWPDEVVDVLREKNYDGRAAMVGMGQRMAGQLRRSIVDTNAPPNAPYTIEKKQSAKPLVDSGLMLRSVDYEVAA